MDTTRRGFLAGAVVPAVMGSVVKTDARARRLREVSGLVESGALTRGEIPTPALVLDLDAFEWNVSKMAGFVRERGRHFRPHAKTHKCPEIARALVAAGAVGACAAKLSEAEVFAEGGIGGLLVTTQVVGPQKIARAVALAARRRDTIFVVDNAASVRDLSEAAAAFKAGAPLTLNVAIDLLYGRTGIEPGSAALDLARVINGQRHVRLAGLQAYDGAASHTVGFEARRARTRETMGRAVETRRLLEQDGIECPMVTGGSTGTYNIDSDIDGITELQPGSFMFMDVDYGRIGGQDGPVYRDFRNALTVVTTVVSRWGRSAIVDGGYKAFSTDKPFTPEAVGLDGVTYSWAGDEHGRLDLSSASRDVKLGDRIAFVIPHCDPSVNLYDALYCVRGERVEAVWKIAARGMSQ
jgi:D-serine deaminase-like pyridoxal phosphate-dependent protein